VRKYSIILLAIIFIGIITTQFVSSSVETSWSSPRHDNQNTGYSQSTVPRTNQTAWENFGVTSLTPIVSDGKVYCTGGKFVNLTVLDQKKGAVLWTKSLGSFSIPTIESGVVYVGTLGGEIWALNGDTGDIIWKYSIFDYGEPLNTPKVLDGRVFFNNRDGWLFCINASNTDFIWKYETRLAEVSQLAVADGRVFTMYSALNVTDGSLLWEYGEKPVGIHWTYHTPTVNGGKVFLSVGPTLVAVDECNGSMIWKFDTVEDASDVAVAYGKVFVSDSGHLYCLDEENGNVVWKYEAEFSWLSSVPSVADGKVLIPAIDRLLCLEADNGTFLWDYSSIRSQSLPAIAEGMVLFVSPEGIVAIGNRNTATGPTDNLGLITTLVSVIIVAIVIVVLILKRRTAHSKN
jgi:outer membrane protein assembly factor BamB